MEMLLIRAGLRPIVSQQKLRPTPTTAAGGSFSSSLTRGNTTGLSFDDAAVLKWGEDAERPTSVIFLCLDERVERRVHDIRNPVEIWEKLLTFYEWKGFSARFYLWQKLFTLQLANYRKHEANAMDLYLDAFRMHVQQLRSSGARVSSPQCLDDGYESFIVSTSQSTPQTADDDDTWSNWSANYTMRTADVQLAEHLQRSVIVVLDQLCIRTGRYHGTCLAATDHSLYATTATKQDTGKTTVGVFAQKKIRITIWQASLTCSSFERLSNSWHHTRRSRSVLKYLLVSPSCLWVHRDKIM